MHFTQADTVRIIIGLWGLATLIGLKIIADLTK
jgi:hypothetical protein